MAEEGAKGAAAPLTLFMRVMGARSFQLSLVHIFIAVTSLFAPICVFPV